jgi:hypothetical protein
MTANFAQISFSLSSTLRLHKSLGLVGLLRLNGVMESLEDGGVI